MENRADKQYDVITAHSVSELVDSLNQWLNAHPDWEVSGGMTFAFNNFPTYHQSVKKKDHPDDR